MNLLKRKLDVIATLALLGAVLCWSVVPLFLKYFTGFIDSWTANGIRYPFAALLYLPILFYFRKRGNFPVRVWKLALLPALINIFSQTCWASAPYFIDPGLMAFLVRLSTLWIVIISFIVFADERVLIHSKGFWLGFVFAVGGFIAMTLGRETALGGATTTGILLVVMTSIFWAGYQIMVRKNMQRVDSRIAFGAIAQITSIGLLGFMFAFGKPEQALAIPLSVTVLVLISGVIGIAAAHVLYYVAIKRVGVAIASSTSLVSAFLTAILSRFLFDERLTHVQWVAGFGLVVGGILLTRAQTHLRIKK